jgi:hypothetical protein
MSIVGERIAKVAVNLIVPVPGTRDLRTLIGSSQVSGQKVEIFSYQRRAALELVVRGERDRKFVIDLCELCDAATVEIERLIKAEETKS